MYKFKQKLLIIFKENKVVGLTIILSLILITTKKDLKKVKIIFY